MRDRYAVIGNPVAHSRSPEIHAAFAAQTGEDLDYQRLLVPREEFAASVAAFRDAGGCGANVTVPFKEEACGVATVLSARARQAGAVNTLRFGPKGIYGDNTDGLGLTRDLIDNLNVVLTGKRILLLGAGGAARGALGPLLEQNPTVLVVANRSEKRAEELVAQFANIANAGANGSGVNRSGVNLAASSFVSLVGRQFDLVINATAASLAGEAIVLPDGIYATGAIAYDMMYGKNDTPFLAAARAKGAHVADGLGMLVEQAAESFFLWRGVRPETRSVLEGLRRRL
ncbi:MAG: shikimate dehydrogenase [Burkholderiales bacterium]